MNFSEKIRAIRVRLGLTQDELATKLGVAFATVNRWEQGATTPQPSAVKKVDEFCNVNNISFEEKQSTGLELITATQIENWFANNPRRAQEVFPALIQRLIKESTTAIPSEIRFPHGDKINSDGFDGFLRISEVVSSYIPDGESVWELGATVKTPAQKVISDYKKRDTQTSVEQKKTSTFILVTPVSFSSSSSEKIKKTIKADSWKEVRVYTSIELCDWLSNCLVTSVWMYKNICNQDLFLDSLVSAYNNLRESTVPPLSSKIFTASREKEKEVFLENIKNKKVIKIASPSFYESYGFVISAMIESDQEENNLRTVICYDYNSLQKINALTRNKIIILKDTISNYNFSNSQNIIILIYGKDTGDNKIDINLNHRAQSVLNKILSDDMKVPTKTLSRLHHSAKNNVFLIARELENETSHLTNPWRERSDLQTLIPILLIGKINVKNDSDKELLSSFLLNEETVDQYLAKIKHWENVDNSPILFYGDYIKVSLKEELWNSIAGYLPEQTIMTLFTTIKTILLTTNPKYDLPKEQQFAHKLYNKVWQYNTYIVEGLLDSCVLLSIYNDKQHEVDILFGEILDSVSTPKEIFTIADYMKLIAECSPEKYLSFIEKEIKNEDSIIWELFANNNTDWLLGGGHDYCNLLWSLEALCKLDLYKIRACNVLLRLTEKQFIYKISNTPLETLESLLWLYNTKNALSIDEKISFIEQSIAKYKNAFIPCALKIIFKTSGFLSDSSLKWRDPELKEEELSYPILYNAIDSVIETVLKHINHSEINIIKSLVDKYLYMTRKTFEKITEYINRSYSPNTAEATSLYDYLLTKRYNAIKYHKDSSSKFIEIIDPIIMQLKPTDELTASLLYFKYFGYNDCPIPETIDEDFEKEERAARKFQHELFDKLLNTYNHNLVLEKIISVMPNNGSDGCFLFESKLNSEDKDFVTLELLKVKKYYTLSTFIARNTEEEKNNLFNGLDKETLIELIPFIQNGYYVPKRVLESEELTKLFFQHRHMNESCSENEKSLIKKHNPVAYFQWILYHQKDEDWDIQEIISVMCNISKDNITSSDYYVLEEILLKLDENYYNEDIVRLEFMLLPIINRNGLPNGLRRYLTENPNEYLTVIDSTQEEVIPLKIKYELMSDMRFPNDFTIQQVTPFIYSLIHHESGDTDKNKAIRHHLGEIIARSFGHTEKEYLPLALKELLEDIDDTEVNYGVYIGYENSIGVRTVTDGSPEIEQALRLEAEAKQCEIAFPSAAHILRMLASARRYKAARDKEERLMIDGIL